MKRILALLTTVFLCLSLSAAAPFSGEAHQPLDSLQALSAVDFTASLAPNQRTWVDRATIHLLTVGEGDPLYAWFGHSALIISQPSGSRVMYDWGIFDSSQDHFYLNFARGRMYYYVLASQADWRIEEAIKEGRDVRLVELSFPAEAKFALISFLQEHLSQGWTTYLYHFYDDNCSTRIRDIINAATGGAFKTWAIAESGKGTLRTLSQQYMVHSPLINWVLSTLQGPGIDRPLNRYQALFLPIELEEAVLGFTYPDGTPLAGEVITINEASRLSVRSEHTRSLVHALVLTFTIALATLILTRCCPSALRLSLGLIYLGVAVLGALLLFMMVASDMDMTYRNWNLVVINPLLIALAVGILKGRRWGSLLSALYAGATLLLLVGHYVLPSLFAQNNLATLLPLLPLYLSGATLERLTDRTER